VVLGSDEHAAQVPLRGETHDPTIRRRGAGTAVLPNA
jgi:hypothetical protein